MDGPSTLPLVRRNWGRPSTPQELFFQIHFWVELSKLIPSGPNYSDPCTFAYFCNQSTLSSFSFASRRELTVGFLYLGTLRLAAGETIAGVRCTTDGDNPLCGNEEAFTVHHTGKCWICWLFNVASRCNHRMNGWLASVCLVGSTCFLLHASTQVRRSGVICRHPQCPEGNKNANKTPPLGGA